MYIDGYLCDKSDTVILIINVFIKIDWRWHSKTKTCYSKCSFNCV